MKSFSLLIITSVFCFFFSVSFAEDAKLPNAAGSFYPDNARELSSKIDSLIAKANPEQMPGEIFALISPHAGYDFSGRVAAYGYKLIKGKSYKTVVVIGPSHFFGFYGISVYPKGAFYTPLGTVGIDEEFTDKLIGKDKSIFFEPQAFAKEHSVEVEIPFLQKMLKENNWKLVPVVMGNCSLEECEKFATLLKDAIGFRKDVLIVASSDMYHGYDYDEAEAVDNLTLSYLKNMDAEGLYNGLREAKLQLCGGLPVTTTLLLAKEMGHNTIKLLAHTNSAEVTKNKIKGIWTVGYCSMAIDNPNDSTLNNAQRQKLLKLARDSIAYYLKNGKKLTIEERDPMLNNKMGAFVTLKEFGQLRGCIGNLEGNQPLYTAIRDMAVEAAVSDPRFRPVAIGELKNIEIEISALSALKRVFSTDEIELGRHGVVVKRNFHSGVFLPQVATETGWSKEEFLSTLCKEKAGLSPDAWKDPGTELYTFTAEVFSEKN